LSGTRFNLAVNETYLQSRVKGKAREGAVDSRSKAGHTHLPCNLLEPRTLAISRQEQTAEGWLVAGRSSLHC
jgi:hypothetical protein